MQVKSAVESSFTLIYVELLPTSYTKCSKRPESIHHYISQILTPILFLFQFFKSRSVFNDPPLEALPATRIQGRKLLAIVFAKECFASVNFGKLPKQSGIGGEKFARHALL